MPTQKQITKLSGWRTRLERFFAEESGLTATEYAIMLAFILVACAAVVGTLGQPFDSQLAGPDANGQLSRDAE